MKRIAFVIPWYGEDIPGGAEAELRGLAHHLLDAGVDLEVLTTCAREFRSDWGADAHRPGKSVCAGVPVRRFPVRKRDKAAFDEVLAKLLGGRMITLREEETYLRETVNSPELCEYIRGHRDEYALFVFIPYLYGTTYYGVQQCFEKAVMIPCLHDECYAGMRLFAQVFPRVRGMIFLSDPERELAERLYGVRGKAFATLGGGLNADFSADAGRFREKYGVGGPFVLYAGRKDAGKRVDELIRYFVRYKQSRPSDLRLVLLGGGRIELPSEEILDLGFVPAQDKYDAYAAARAFCNPSQMESFSIVIMESWMAGTPVLVNGHCEVTTDFVKKAGGGLYYTCYGQFAAALDYLLEHEDTARRMGASGRAFVRENFAWDVIVDRYTRYFEALASGKM